MCCLAGRGQRHGSGIMRREQEMLRHPDGILSMSVWADE